MKRDTIMLPPSSDRRSIEDLPALEKFSTLALWLTVACNGATTEADTPAGGGSASTASVGTNGTTTLGPPETGEVQSPMLPIEGDDGFTILGSTLGRNPDGQIRWTFTFRNETAEPFCGTLVNATLFDAGGEMIAGASVFSDEYAAGFPAFTGIVMGSIHRGVNGSGVFLDACVPPGGRGLALAEVWSSIGLLPEEIDRLLASAAKLGHDLIPISPSLDNLEPAPTMPRLDQLQLVETPEGKLVQGMAVSSADLYDWRAWFVLYDASGVIVDVVHAPTNVFETLKDMPVQFSSAPALATATRFDVFFEWSTLRH